MIPGARSLTLLIPSRISTVSLRTFLEPVRCKTFEPAISPPLDTTQTYTDFIESSEEFKYVQRLLPRDTIPSPPLKSLTQFPTPSGWIPPAPVAPPLPYFVKRTCWHNLPVYLMVFEHGTKKLTAIRHVQGDLWQMEKELREFLTPHSFDGLVATQVGEVNRFIRVKGDYVELCKQFLVERGF